MHDALIRRYHALPPSMRSLIASARGVYLRAWRYGPETDSLRDEALARDYWTAKEWNSWREERLSNLLHRCVTRVPYYREQWAARRRRGDKASWELLENWPVLEKETLRQRPMDFVAEDCSVKRMYHEHTSGTTGKSLDLWFSRSTVRRWYALFEARCRQWNGLSRNDNWGITGGQLVTPVDQSVPPFWVWNAPLHQLYLSSYHLNPSNISAYVDAMGKYGIRYLVGYPSALHTIAREILEQGLSLRPLECVLSNAEPLFDNQRRDIATAFHCAVRDTYGLAEMVAAASECSYGRMHLWPEVGTVEVETGHGSGSDEGTGELISTGLLNADMPLVRYRLGDRGSLAPPNLKCECGRSLPILGQIEGRNDDLLYTVDGRVIGRLDPVFKARLPIHEAQIIQEALAVIRVRYIPAHDFTQADGASLIERIRQRMGNVEVILEEVQAIPRTGNGKFKAVICHVPETERERFRSRR